MLSRKALGYLRGYAASGAVCIAAGWYFHLALLVLLGTMLGVIGLAWLAQYKALKREKL